MKYDSVVTMEHGAHLSSSGCWDGLKLPSTETALTLVSHHISLILKNNSCQWLFSLNEQGGQAAVGHARFYCLQSFFNAGFAQKDTAANMSRMKETKTKLLHASFCTLKNTTKCLFADPAITRTAGFTCHYC